MNDLAYLPLFLLCAVASWGGTWLAIRLLTKRAILDRPNERSSHTIPTPRGGGLAVTAVLVAGAAVCITLWPQTRNEVWVVIAGLIALALLSWIDDLKNLSAAVRLIVHAVVVAAALWMLPGEALVFQGWLPPLADRILAGLLWIWFINLFNFMDGIDGISGIETIAIGAGLFGLSLMLPALMPEGRFGLIAAGAAIGFLLWNWHPARIFLGDVGSVPLGFFLGWLLLETAAAGHWAAALILPLYYLADATITLIKRAMRREKVWQAHREHFYQQPIQRGVAHDRVALRIALANAALIGLALLSTVAMAWLCLLFALLVVARLLLWMSQAERRA
ncbi:MAG TPA: glycosyltransferase family 4 protein [Alphaproteobacteria bacterium]|nr:glycosyltransferase family 4 protein [Alphaproteobacteria bacterium]